MRNRRVVLMSLLLVVVSMTVFAADSACVREGQHAIVEMKSAEPARVYFRSMKTGAEDYLDMQRDGSKSWAVLPKAATGVESIDYRVATRSGDTYVTAAKQTLKVTADCKVREFTAEQARATAAIVVGATIANAPLVPAGFRCDGIAGRISEKGILSARSACSEQASKALAVAATQDPQTTVATSGVADAKKATADSLIAEAEGGVAVNSHRPGRRPPIIPPPPNPRRPGPVDPPVSRGRP